MATDIQVATIQDLENRSTSGLANNTIAEVLVYDSFYTDFGGGLYYYDNSSSSSAEPGLVVVPTSNTGRWKRVLPASVDLRTLNIQTDSTDYTSRINAILSNAGVTEIVIDTIQIKITGTVSVPSEKKLVFRNNGQFVDTGSIDGGIVECNVLEQCFASSLDEIKNLQNSMLSVCWFGAIPDNTTDCLDAFKKCIAAFKPSHSSNPTYTRTINRVYVPAGSNKYYCSNQLEIDCAINFFGDGIESTAIRFPSGLGKSAIYFKPLTLPSHVTYSSHDFTCLIDNSNVIPTIGGSATWQDNGASIGSPAWDNTTAYTALKKGGQRPFAHDFSIYGNTGEGGSANPFDEVSHGIEVKTPLSVFERVSVNFFDGNGWQIVAAAPNSNANNSRFHYCEGIQCSGSGMFLQSSDANNCLVTSFNGYSNGKFGIWDDSFLGNTFVACHCANNALESVFNTTSVNHGGQEYYCIQDHTAGSTNEPGVGANWQDYWIHIGPVRSWLTVFFKNWNSTNTYTYGSDYYFSNLNQLGTALGCYMEESGYNVHNIGNTEIIGGFITISKPAGYLQYTGEGYLLDILSAFDKINNVYTRIDGQNQLLGFFDVDNNARLAWKYWKDGHSVSWSRNNGNGRVWLCTWESNAGYLDRSETPSDSFMEVGDGIFLGIHGLSDKYRNLKFTTGRPTTGTWAAGDIVYEKDPSTKIFGYQATISATNTVLDPNAAGFKAMGGTSGTTAQRPTASLTTIDEGFQYFNTNLGLNGKPIWWNGSAWVYADGTLV